MTAVAATLQGFFTERLTQRGVSPHTVAAYRDSLRLLVCFVHDTTGKAPSRLDFDDLDADTVSDFLRHIETVRHSSVATRNARLAAVHSLFRYAALRHPEHAATIGRVLAIPTKRHERTQVCFLTQPETEALLAAPDRSKRTGRRDHALLLTALQTGLRASELLGMRVTDVHLETGPHVDCVGKGRKHRSTPLLSGTVAVLDAWLKEHADSPSDPVFPGPRGERLSRNALGQLVTKHANTAASACPSLASKNVTPHVFRHTCAMRLLENGVDTTVISMWLGHESLRSTQIYLTAHMALKEQALARLTPPETKAGRYTPPDDVLGFLDSL
ncbi:tyrosine-type recombinase/integrase [soil metagenome]